MTLLEKKLEMQKLPFFDGTETDPTKHRADALEYYNLGDQISNSAKNLKIGDRVQFIWAEKIKNKNSSFGFNLKWRILEGTIKQPLKPIRRKGYEEDTIHEVIKIASGGYIYPVSPDEVVKL